MGQIPQDPSSYPKHSTSHLVSQHPSQSERGRCYTASNTVTGFNSLLVGGNSMPQSRREALCTQRPTYQVPDVPFSCWHHSKDCSHLNISTESKAASTQGDRHFLNVRVGAVEMHRDNEIPIGLSFSCSGQLP